VGRERDGTVHFHYKVDADEFIDWSEMSKLHELGGSDAAGGWQVWTRVTVEADESLSHYLKSPGGRSFNMAPRWATHHSLALLNLATIQSMYQIEKLGWVPESVEVMGRWEPKKPKKKR